MKKIVLAGISAFSWAQQMSAQDSVIIPGQVFLQAGLDTHFIARFSLFVACLLMGTIAVGKLLKATLRLPVIAGQIIGGIILGPSLCNIKDWAVFAHPFTVLHGNISYSFASSDLFLFFVLLISAAFTVAYLLWIAGHETDIKDILKVGVTAVSAGVLGALVPIAMTAVITQLFLSGTFTLVRSVAIGLVFSATSVSIPVAMLFAQNKMHLKSSKATLGAAIIDDIVAVVLLSLFFICVQSGLFGVIPGVVMPGHSVGIFYALTYMVVAFVVLFVTGLFVISPVMSWLKDQRYSHLIASSANIFMFLYFAFSELVGGIAGITGAYFAGFFHRMGDKKHHAEKTISPYVNALLLPLFLGSIGLQVDISILSFTQWMIVLFLLVIAVVSKMLACYVATFLSNISGRRGDHGWDSLESYLFGASMVARGEVGLVIATILQGAGFVTYEQYIICVVVIILTTIAAPIMLALGFAQLDKRAQIIDVEQDFEINLGYFPTIGTAQMFNVILQHAQKTEGCNTSIRFSEGHKVLHLEGRHVDVIFAPERGLIVKGNKKNIHKILTSLKNQLTHDIDHVAEA